VIARRRLGEKLLLSLIFGIFIPMCWTVPLYRDREYPWLLDFNWKSTFEVMSWWMPASAAIWVPMTVYSASRDYDPGWSLEVFVIMVAAPLLIGSAAAYPLRTQESYDYAPGEHPLLRIFDGLLCVPYTILGAIVFTAVQYFFLEYRRYWKHVKSALGSGKGIEHPRLEVRLPNDNSMLDALTSIEGCCVQCRVEC